MENFTPVPATLGGLLIGISAVLLLWLNGRIAGISGILHGATGPGTTDRLWRWLFLLGLGLGAGSFAWTTGPGFELRTGYPLPLLVLAGFLVGFGTRLGGGCTSGHGVCGMARLSPRSLLATLTFMLAGFVTVFVARHLLGVPV